jgi:glycosyltransferase involved in cell wall biosynthesis
MKLIKIAVPTYNRVNTVIRLLARLSNFTNHPDITIEVFDNNSDNGDLIKCYCTDNNISYTNRPANIGGLQNILRCIEESDSKWTIVFSDDDLPEKDFLIDSINLINQYSAANPIAIKTKTSLHPKQSNIIIKSLDEYLIYNSAPDKNSSNLFITSWIFNTAKIKRNIKYAYQNSDYLAAYLIPIIYCLQQKDGPLIYSETQTIIYCKPEITEEWSKSITFTKMLMSLGTMHFLTKDQLLLLAKPILGHSVKNLGGILIRAKAFNHGLCFKQISNIAEQSSFRNMILTKIFKLMLKITPNIIIKKISKNEIDVKKINRL